MTGGQAASPPPHPHPWPQCYEVSDKNNNTYQARVCSYKILSNNGLTVNGTNTYASYCLVHWSSRDHLNDMVFQVKEGIFSQSVLLYSKVQYLSTKTFWFRKLWIQIRIILLTKGAMGSMWLEHSKAPFPQWNSVKNPAHRPSLGWKGHMYNSWCMGNNISQLLKLLNQKYLKALFRKEVWAINIFYQK